MRIPRIYIDQILDENTELQLDGAVAHYLATVLRMKAGRKVMLFNGSGKEYHADLDVVEKKRVVIQINSASTPSVESPLAIELGCCLIKNDRMDWMLQKATELGVSSISPLLSEYTDVKLSSERIEKKLAHWEKIIISACEQSRRIILPTLNQPQRIEEWLDNVEADKKIQLHPYNAQGFSTLNEAKDKINTLSLLVGPEGGLSKDEVDSAIAKGFVSLSLGPRILRAETAPLSAIAIIQSILGDY